ncbi:MAG: cytidine deaminase [Oscillospiraceae bacterium]|nr:cytidine deaminase [Oscillospiraceae bacterium]
MDDNIREKLVQAAREARLKAHCPYSRYQVGAAVLGEDGKIYSGCNIENVSYGATVCGERVAIFNMVSEGCKKYEALAVATGDDFDCAPCCICRQVMLEFCSSLDVPVFTACPIGTQDALTLRELAPLPFMAFDANKDYKA